MRILLEKVIFIINIFLDYYYLGNISWCVWKYQISFSFTFIQNNGCFQITCDLGGQVLLDVNGEANSLIYILLTFLFSWLTY